MEVLVVDTATLDTVARVPLEIPAFDLVPAPEGESVLVSTLNTEDRDLWGTRLLALPSGQELGFWPSPLTGMQSLAPDR